MLSRAQFAHLVSTIRQANAKTYYGAYALRFSLRPTFHAKRLAYWIGLRISLSKAYSLDQKYIAARPMPELATPSPVLDLVYPYSEEELRSISAAAPPAVHMRTYTHNLTHTHTVGACQVSIPVDWQQQQELQQLQDGPSVTPGCGHIPYIVVSPPESISPPHHHHSSLHQHPRSQQTHTQAQPQTRLTIRIPPMSLARYDDVIPVPGAPLLGTMDLPMMDDDDTQYDSEASDLSTSSSSEEAMTPEPMDVSSEEPALHIRLAPKRKLQDVEDEDCAYETVCSDGNDLAGQPEAPKYAMKRRWRHTSVSPSRSGIAAGAGINVGARGRRSQRC